MSKSFALQRYRILQFSLIQYGYRIMSVNENSYVERKRKIF